MNSFDNTFQAPPARTSSVRSPGHIRSASGRLPSSLGTGRSNLGHVTDLGHTTAPEGNNVDGNVESELSRHATRSQVSEDDFDSGRCATCDQRVKWPKSRSEYRCGTCLMINDLTPKTLEREPPNLVLNATGSPLGDTLPNVPSLNAEAAQALIDQCVLEFLNARLGTQDFQGTAVPLQDAETQFPSLSTHLDSHTGGTLLVRTSSMSQKASAPPSQSLQSRGIYQGRTLSSANEQRIQRNETGTLSGTLPQTTIDSPVRKPLLIHNNASYRGPVRSSSIPLDLNASSPKGAPTSRYSAIRPRPSDGIDIDRGEVQPSTHERGEDAGVKYPNKKIFKPLEEYIARNFGTYDCLNAAFTKPNRRPRAGTKGGGDTSLWQDAKTKKESSATTVLSAIDPKTLLLGDIAENGLWWIGKHDRTTKSPSIPDKRDNRIPQQFSDLVSSRSPYISWIDVSHWYSAILNAGRDWRSTLQVHRHAESKDSFSLPSHEEEIKVDTALAEARSHVHRVLLRTSDNLLKRPGRPLKAAGCLRFLLILLANPMLYPGLYCPPMSVASMPLEQCLDNQKIVGGTGNKGEVSRKPSETGDQSHAFAILKRILGLLSNTPSECQRYLTSWFSRYSEVHFRSLVELIQTYISYRVRRQSSRKQTKGKSVANDLIPSLSGLGASASAELHAALGLSGKASMPKDKSDDYPIYSDDWQARAAARVMALLFAANKSFQGEGVQSLRTVDAATPKPWSLSRHHMKIHGQLLSTTEFYNSMVDYCDLVFDFDTWEGFPSKFTFCQYPFFLSVGSKIRIMEHDARRQMEIKAREALFKSILRNSVVERYMILKVRRECLVEDSLKGISEVVGQGQEEIKKGLKVQFVHEEGVDAGGLRKEWFLLLVREIFDPQHAMFIYDEDSNLCYFNPHSFETSDQYFLVGALLGLAIYNSTILDVALPGFVYKKLLLSEGATKSRASHFTKGRLHYSLEDLAEWRPRLAKGLRDLLEFEGNVEEVFCRDFTIQVDHYGKVEQIDLCPGGSKRPVTNGNRLEFVELYIRYLLEGQVTRQFEPFKRGFFTVCGGNALSLFQPEEIELLVRGSEEPLDVPSLKAVAVYENWRALVPNCQEPAAEVALLGWFWETVEAASTSDQRKLLSFVTGSDRIPAVGATNLVIKVVYGGPDARRLPIARTCFNQILLYGYRSRQEVEKKLWMAVSGSQGFGLV